MSRSHPAIFAALMLLALGSTLSAQSEGLSIRATRRDSLPAGATVTAAFAVSNGRADTVRVMPHVELPKDWTILMGGAEFTVSPRTIETLMLSVVVPSRAAAGAYPLRMWVTTTQDPRGVADSVIVVVPPRRALELGLIDRPGFVVSGKDYAAGFLLRNRGNMAARVRLRARSSLGAATMIDTIVGLESEESRIVHARVLTPTGLQAATDDVLEIGATQVEDSSMAAEASARVTVVPEPNRKIEEYLRMPTQVHLRAASSDGVSPFEIFGRGVIRDGGQTQMDFLFRGPTGKFSAFGERDEYRAALIAPNWRLRAGDQLFMLSSLTGVGQPGFGLGADATRGAFSVGGYGEQFRRIPGRGNETGAFVSARPMDDARLALNFVDRTGGFLPGQIGSASASLDGQSYDAAVEVARSFGPAKRVAGLARSARVSGGSRLFSYDLGHQFADTSFSGTQRGSEHDYVTTSTRTSDAASFAANGSMHRTDLSRSTGVPYVERLKIGNVAATLFDRFTLEAGVVERATIIQSATQNARQRGLRVRGEQDLAFGVLSLEAELGRAHERAGNAQTFSDMSLGARRSFDRGALALWTDRYSGGSITKGSDGTVTVGGDASMRVSRTTDFMLTGYATRLTTDGTQWHSQLDAQLSYSLPNGNSLTLRARLTSGGTLRAADQGVAYLEYGVPLRLPVSHLRTTGRVYGTVVDAVTGEGVPGALVRLGPQAAITDRRGQVAFGGVPGGEHRVSMSQETSFADAVFVGDPTLRVDSTRTQPTTFKLAIARSAHVDVVVRRFATVRTAVAGAPDSLLEAGPLANATLVLAGERDTLYRTTSDNGKVSFTDVPPGKWIITIRGDAPAFHRFDPDRLELTLAPGESKALAFRLVPRKREVQLIGEGQELRPTTTESKAVTPAGTVRIVKPNDKQQQQ